LSLSALPITNRGVGSSLAWSVAVWLAAVLSKLPRLPKAKTRKERPKLLARAAKKNATLLRLPSIKKQASLGMSNETGSESSDSSDDDSFDVKFLAKRPLINTKPIKRSQQRRSSVLSKIVHHIAIHSAEHQKIAGAQV
jgi:hypothetical protein